MIKLVIFYVAMFTGAAPLAAFATELADPIKRWYGPEQLATGQVVYQKNCATCHGKDAASVAGWEKMDKNGQFPPPPLNGSAHTWHHPMPLLRRTIREGGIAQGGRMPAFKASLSNQEIDGVIAWFQSYWPDDKYANWSGEPLPNNASKKVPWSLNEFLEP